MFKEPDMVKKISFCTNCKGRLWQLSQTLANNVKVLDDDSEIIILDYQSPDQLKEWLFGNFAEEIASGKLKYFHLEHGYNYSCAYAKNVAHKLATGDVLFNLDGDNTISVGLLRELRKLHDNSVLVPFYTGYDNGSAGRLGYTKETFIRLNGYNETIVGLGCDDGDFVNRLLALDGRLMPSNERYSVIQNTVEQQQIYLNVPGLVNPPVDYPLHWGKATVTDKDNNIIDL